MCNVYLNLSKAVCSFLERVTFPLSSMVWLLILPQILTYYKMWQKQFSLMRTVLTCQYEYMLWTILWRRQAKFWPGHGPCQVVPYTCEVTMTHIWHLLSTYDHIVGQQLGERQNFWYVQRVEGVAFDSPSSEIACPHAHPRLSCLTSVDTQVHDITAPFFKYLLTSS